MPFFAHFPFLSFICICFKGEWDVRMENITKVEKGKLKVDRRILFQAWYNEKSNVHKETKKVLISSLHHCDEVQYMTLRPLLLPWEWEIRCLLYSGQNRKFLAGFETFNKISVKKTFHGFQQNPWKLKPTDYNEPLECNWSTAVLFTFN